MSNRQHDAHVRARKRLIKRVYDRMLDWRVEGASETLAARRIAVTTYFGMHGKDISAGTIHAIMCAFDVEPTREERRAAR